MIQVYDTKIYINQFKNGGQNDSCIWKHVSHRGANDKANKNTLTVCSCHVTFEFKSESTLYSCLYVKELLIRNRDEI